MDDEASNSSHADAGPVQQLVGRPAPWGDCKVAFDFDCGDKAIWDALYPPATAPYKLPPGWTLDETDGSCARQVAVFRIDGVPRIEDGEKVAEILLLIGRPNAKLTGACTAAPTREDASGRPVE